jgi:subtilisin family serine protease
MAGKDRRPRRPHRGRAPRLELERLEARTVLDGTGPDPSPDLLVGFVPQAGAAAISAALASVGGVVSQAFSDGSDLVALPAGLDPSAALGRLKADPAVAYAEADGPIAAASIMANDKYFPLQWGLNNGDNVDIDAPEAWSITTGNPSVIVAVLDTGVDLRNPDLTARLWTNPTANVDGYSGDIHGWNFTKSNGNLQDNNGHGSHVTGILAAAGNNGNGIAGVDWNARIMPLKILGPNGTGSISSAVAAINFAVDHGAKVISASWGGNQFSQAMENAISYADSKGVVFVTAAGNDGVNNDVSTGEYPANYHLPNMLVVAAVDSSGNLASFSDYGPGTVDVAGPGVDIFSTVKGGYATYSGTSMATPFAAGVVSLLAGLHPELGAEDLVKRVIATAKPLPSLAGKIVSGGIVDAYNALTDTPSAQSATASTSPPPPPPPVSIQGVGRHTNAALSTEGAATGLHLLVEPVAAHGHTRRAHSVTAAASRHPRHPVEILVRSTSTRPSWLTWSSSRFGLQETRDGSAS